MSRKSKRAAAADERPERPRAVPAPAGPPRSALVWVLGATAAAYLNALAGRFVYDDHFLVLANPALESPKALLASLLRPQWRFMTNVAGVQGGRYFRPLFTAALAVQGWVFGGSPVGWHAASLALHLLATFLVYRLAKAWTLGDETALVAALLFGLHPVHAEAVAWVAALGDPMAGCLVLGALLLHERGRIVPAALLGLLAMLSKEAALALPLVVLARELLGRRGPGTAVLRALPAGFAALLALSLRYASLGFLSAPDPGSSGVAVTHLLLTVPRVVVSYLRMLVLPFGLGIAYGVEYVTSPASLAFLLPAAVLAALALFAARRRWSAAEGSALAVLVAFLLPVLDLRVFNAKESLLHDRYLYLPSIGFCLIAAGRLVSAASTARSRAALACGIGAVLFVLTVRQNGYFHDDVALVQRGLDVAGRRPFLLSYHAGLQLEGGRPDAAAATLQEALRIEPENRDALLNLAEVRRAQGRNADAEDAYRRAVRAGASAPDVYANFGLVLLLEGKGAEAEGWLQKALALDATQVPARYNLAWAYQKDARNADAEREYRETLKRSPEYAEARVNLGAVLLAQGKGPEAETELAEAERLAAGNEALRKRIAEVRATAKTGR
jgi:Tfp pilus assembly protein PilF